jgi:undecaprenyl-diphosphatase
VNVIQAIVLGLVQGATEFIPVSSSAHLVLVPWLLGWAEPGLLFDVLLHLGTLLAVLAVFWRDLLNLVAPWWDSVRRRKLDTPESRLAWWIILGTIPTVLMYVLWGDQFEALFHSPQRVSLVLLVTGLWLALAERLGRKEGQAEDMGWPQSLLIGVAQGCAMAPGISRSGATIGAGMLLGLKRDAAARFSFLLAIPVVLGAGLVKVIDLLGTRSLDTPLSPLLLGVFVAFLSGYACIRFLLAYLKRRGLGIFAAYCWLVGLGTLTLYFLR